MINKSAVMTEKKRMVVVRTVRAGQHLIKGADKGRLRKNKKYSPIHVGCYRVYSALLKVR